MTLDRRTFVGVTAAGLLAGCTGDSPDSTTSPDSADTPQMEGTQTATLQTSMGAITVDLYGDRAPRTVENFVGLATGPKRAKPRPHSRRT